MLLNTDENNIWEDDSELGFDLKGKEEYSKALDKLSGISSGVFQPKNVTEKWKTDAGPIEVSYSHGGVTHTFEPEFLDDYLDIDAVVESSNQTVKPLGYQFKNDSTGDQTFCIVFSNLKKEAVVSKKEVSLNKNEENKQPVLILVAYLSKEWALNPKAVKKLVHGVFEGGYGFTPNFVSYYGKKKLYSLPQYKEGILEDLENEKTEGLTAETSSNATTEFDLSISKISCTILSIKIPYEPSEIDDMWVNSILNISKKLIQETNPLFLRVHDYLGWRQLHRERRGHRIFVPSVVDGAYWLTYFCQEYIEKLGGKEKIYSSPAFKHFSVDNGILLQSHPNFLELVDEPKKSELNNLHNYLKNLVQPEDRP